MSFEFQSLEIPDVLLVRMERYKDARGFFQETFRETPFMDAGIQERFVQENFVCSMQGVLRGLHYQLPPQDPQLSDHLFHSEVPLPHQLANFVQCVCMDVLLIQFTNQHLIYKIL